MRVFVGAPTESIKVWQISKIQDNQTPARGVKMITLSLDMRNDNTDYVNVDTKEFYADYYAGVLPKDSPDEPSDTQEIICSLTASNDQIKVKGSYKTITANFYDASGSKLTDEILSSSSFSWSAEIDGEDVTDSDLITWRKQDALNVIKIKFGNDRSYLTKILVIKCKSKYNNQAIIGEIQLKIVSI